MWCCCSHPGATAHDSAPLVEWSDLPPNVLLRVFSCLSLTELCTASRVCWSWHAVTQSHDSLWCSLLQHHGGRLSKPLPTTSSCRHSLLQLHTSSLWAAGVCNTELLTPSSPDPSKLELSSTEPVELWSAAAARGGAAKHEGPRRLSPAHHFLNRANYVQQPPVAVAAGGDFLALLDARGQVCITWGAFVLPPHDRRPAADAAAGPAGLAAAAEAPRLTYNLAWSPPAGVPVKSIAAGNEHVLAVCGDGRLWGWGSNIHGQLGVGNTEWQAEPVDITAVLDGAWKSESERVVAAACGFKHSAILMDSGALYTAGSNETGQCGVDLQERICLLFSRPSLAPPNNSAEDVADEASSSSSSSAAAAAAAGGAAPHHQSLPPAAAIAAGRCHTLVVTRTGRVLVCGSASSGECGEAAMDAAWMRRGRVRGFFDVGPDISWHGLTPPTAAEVEAAGGKEADALPKVVQVAAAWGTCYALADGGEVFAWGQGSNGQLGSSGCPLQQPTPTKLLQLHNIRQISASHTGRFAAAVDARGKLYTWGAGKWGELCHGDTSKRTVGRLVKQLRHLHVLQVCCGAEATLVLTCQQLPPTVQQPQHHHSATADITQPQQHQQHQQGQHEQAPTTNDTASTAAAAAASSSPKQPQPQRKAKQSKGPKQRAQDTCSQAQHNPAGALAASSTSTSSGSSRARVGGKHGRKGRHSELAPVDSSAAADEAAEAAESSSLLQLPGGNNRSTPTVGVPWQDVEEQGPYFCPPVRVGNKASGSRSSQLQDFDDDEDAAARSSSNRRRRSASGAASSTSSDNVSSSSRHPRMDKGFKRLLRRLLTGFLADSSQRELTFPASLSPADRYHVHVAAEAWGLAHASHNKGADRVIKVWKVSRTKKPAPSFDEELGYDSD